MNFFNQDSKADAVRKELGADLQKLSEQIGTLQQELKAKNDELEQAHAAVAQAQQAASTSTQSNQDQMASALQHSAQMQQLNDEAAKRSAELTDTQAKLTALEAQLAQATAGATPPTASAQPEHAAQASGAVGLQVGGTAYVAQAGGLPLRLRSSPGLAADSVIGRLPPGTQMTLLGGPEDHDGYTWWHIRTSGGEEGWVAGQDLRTQPE